MGKSKGKLDALLLEAAGVAPAPVQACAGSGFPVGSIIILILIIIIIVSIIFSSSFFLFFVAFF